MPMKPPSWSVRNSSSFPSPSRSGRATLVASNSSQSVDPCRRFRKNRLRTFQLPIQKSKSPALLISASSLTCVLVTLARK